MRAEEIKERQDIGILSDSEELSVGGREPKRTCNYNANFWCASQIIFEAL